MEIQNKNKKLKLTLIFSGSLSGWFTSLWTLISNHCHLNNRNALTY